MRAVRLVLAGLALVVTGFGTAPALARAAASWQDSPLFYTIGTNCNSIIIGHPIVERQVAGDAGFLADPKHPPHAGDVFYVHTLTASVGNICGGGAHAIPTFDFPRGVRPAVTKKHPIYWSYQSAGHKVHYFKKHYRLGRDFYGGLSISHVAKSGKSEPWVLANGGAVLEIQVPVRSERRLVGVGSLQPHCPQREQGRACPPSESGDHLQVYLDTSVSDDITPFVGLFAGPPRAPRLKVTRGPRVRVATAPRARVRGAILAGGQIVRRFAGRAGIDGTARLRPKLGRAARAAIRRAGGRAELRVTARTTDGSVSPVATRSFRI